MTTADEEVEEYTFADLRECDRQGRHLTCIHGKVYDLTEFKHPGGNAIHSAIGIDATNLFEVSHNLLTNQSYRKQLESLCVGKMKDYQHNFIYDSEFSKACVKVALEVIAGRPHREVASNYHLIIFSLTCYSLTLVWFCLAPSVLAGIFCGLAASHIIIVMHLATHHALSKRDIVNYIAQHLALLPFLFGGPDNWDMLHIMSHHPYINTNRDYEVQRLTSFKNFDTPDPIRIYHYISVSISHPATLVAFQTNLLGFNTEAFVSFWRMLLMLVFHLSFGFLFYFLKLLMPLWTHPGPTMYLPISPDNIPVNEDGIGPNVWCFRNETSRLYREQVIACYFHWIYFLLFLYFNPTMPWIDMLFYFGIQAFVMNMTYTFMVNPIHNTAEIEETLTATVAPNTDFYRHSASNTVSSTMTDFLPDFLAKNYTFLAFIGGGFNSSHIAHHLFPCLAVEYLPEIEARLRPVFELYGVPFHNSNNFIKLYHHLRGLANPK